jgi:phage head maturation protease
MRTGSIGLSFGYLTQKQRKAADGANELLALDLFEVSLTPAPANPDTRVLNMKRVDADRDAEFDRIRTRERDRMFKLLTDAATGGRTEGKAIDRKSTGPVQIASFEC